MAFTRRASRRSEALSWQNELKKECYWQNELSFTNLKLNLKLVKNYHEWRSLQKSFRYKNVTSDNILKWLRNQQGQFRKSYLHYLLVTGYSRGCNVSFCNLPYAPKDIQDIILCYTNLLFIRLYTNSNENVSNPTLRTFDCNLTINNLTVILKKTENHYKDSSDLRLWTRFDMIKFIYSVQKSGSDERVYTDLYHDKEGLEDDKERARWVEIPRDYSKQLLFKDVDDKLQFHQVLEFGVDKARKVYIEQKPGSISKWTFKADEQEDDEYNHFEFIQSLKIGDKIDVDIGHALPWLNAYIFGRDYDTFYVYIENANKYRIYPYWDIKSIGMDNLSRLQRRNTRCECNDKSLIPSKVNHCNLVYCEWMTAFDTVISSAHYPILFE